MDNDNPNEERVAKRFPGNGEIIKPKLSSAGGGGAAIDSALHWSGAMAEGIIQA
jgi:hypothetical protein